jgi:hypothetical protein
MLTDAAVFEPDFNDEPHRCVFWMIGHPRAGGESTRSPRFIDLRRAYVGRHKQEDTEHRTLRGTPDRFELEHPTDIRLSVDVEQCRPLRTNL